MNFPVADATEPFTLVNVAIQLSDAEHIVEAVIGRLHDQCGYTLDDRRLAADIVRFSLMSLDLLEFAYTAREKNAVLTRIDRSLGEGLEWLYTALIAALRDLPDGFDEAEKQRIIGAFLATCTFTQDDAIA